ncbi:MAG: glycosyltransferase [Pseudomonadota bacterium]
MTSARPFGIVTKADAAHYPGLAALLASLRQHMESTPVVVLDCGLAPEQRETIQRHGARLRTVDVSGYEIRREADHGKFTGAIYALLEADLSEWPVTIALDADTLVLGDLSEIAQAAMRSGIAAVPDFPPLSLGHQIGNEGALNQVLGLLPELDVGAIAFNAGVLGIRGDYFEERLQPAARRLIPFHAKLWGNDQAILNLAAYQANPVAPFEVLDRKYNARPRYRRAPEIEPPQQTQSPAGPGLNQGGTPIRVLHFIGHPKPWMHEYPQDCPGLETWRAYAAIAEVA